VAGDPSAQPGGFPTGLVPGARVAGYLLQSQIGLGGTAAVFRARDERLGRVVALKLLAAELTRDEAFRQRFLREARAIAAVDHPHIIPVYEAGEASGVLFIAMRFVAGGDLRTLVGREGGLPPERAAALLSPVASALDAAHATGLVHRDVKPANMLVDTGPGRPEHVYLSDFGLARGLQSAGLTRAGQFLGTPDYSAPEQISGRAVDGRADQYGLACVAYTLLAGSVLFERDQPMAVLYAHLFQPPPRVTAVRPDLPGAVDQVLARALAKTPEARYDSCGAFADALRHALGVAPYATLGTTVPARRLPATPVTATVAVTQPSALTTAPDPPPPPPVTAASVTAASGTAAPVATAPVTAAPVATAPVTTASPQPDPARPGPAAAGTWTAVVSADRAYYDSVQVESPSDAALISFPDHCPERRFVLSGTEVRIGRRSASRRIEPEIDLTGPPADPGVSRLHAKLVAAPDGTWSAVDLGSPNGTLVNGHEIPQGKAIPLHPGDRLNLGAWTRITITRA
jgi:tRNA A-37 threonylcarbamoyl transferase component Bud32